MHSLVDLSSEGILIFYQKNFPLTKHGLLSMSFFWVKGVTKLMEAKSCILIVGFLRKKILVLDSTKFNESAGKGYIVVAPFL